MKPGKISENVLKRSVLKYIEHGKEEIARGAGIGNDCALFASCQSVATNTCALAVKGAVQIRHAIHAAVNTLAAGGQKAEFILLNITVAERVREKKLQEMMEEAAKLCKELDLQIIGGHTEISNHVEGIVTSVTALGRPMGGQDNAHSDRSVERSGAKEEPRGYDIVVSGYVGMEAAALIASEKEEELLERFPRRFVEEAKEFAREISAVKAARIGLEQEAFLMHDIREGGIFGALWEMAQRIQKGLVIDLKKIPMKQTVVEICNYYDLNPYELLSQGCMLFLTKNGEQLTEILWENDIMAAVIGTITNTNDRIIENGEEIRYMDLPKPDQIRKLL